MTDTSINCGGNVVRTLERAGTTVLSDATYFYSLHCLTPGDEHSVAALAEYTIFVQEGGAAGVEATVGDRRLTLASFDSADVRGLPAKLRNPGPGDALVLVAGLRGSSTEQAVEVLRAKDAKRVFKPWGHELWINHHNQGYLLKEVMLKAGRKTSLQYHRMKQETNLLFEGQANIWFKSAPHIANDEVLAAHTDSTPLDALALVDVEPNILHRIEAVTDVRLYEASTPHADDVVRVQDDLNRPNGRLDTEHQLQLCILTAGRGERMGGLCDVLNKALLPVGGQAAISRLIEKFPKNTRVVVALGYHGAQVRNYLEAAYPEHEFEFVTIDNFDQPGSGPGYSLAKCRNALREKPFYWVACDTLIEDAIPFDLHEDWMGVSGVNYAISDRYCNFTIENGVIVSMADKEPYRDNHSKSYIGISYIRDTATFWAGLQDRTLHKGEWQMTNGIRHMIGQKPVRAVDFRWTDLGSYQQYVELTSKRDGFDFGKTDEFLYVTNDRVIKFFRDPQITANRVARAHHNPAAFPPVAAAHGQFYAYDFVPGHTLYERCDLQMFESLLGWLEATVWVRRPEVALEAACLRFYRDKTTERVERFFEKYPRLRGQERPINGVMYTPAERLLAALDWQALARESIPAFIHGDLQFDNILCGERGFVLIDWRQDFAGLLEAGDLYYDLAKLYGGLVLNYDFIKQNLFSYAEDDSGIHFDFHVRGTMADYQKVLEAFILSRGLSLPKVKKLVGLIYLNMSPLHHYPFDKLLFALGTKLLNDAEKP